MSQPFAIDRHGPRVVLAGSSLGPESDAVVRAALRLARAGGGRLYLVHALEPPPVPAGAFGFALAEPHLASRARTRLEEQLDRAGALSDELAGLDVELGSAGTVLAAAAGRLGADVVVVGAFAAMPLPLHRVGSTVRELLRDGNRPVFVVKGEPNIPPRRVLAPLDLSLLAADALRCGLALLAPPGHGDPPELLALHAVDERNGEPVPRPREALARFLAERVADYDGAIRYEVRESDALKAILAAGERDQPDLVLLGTHGRSGWQRLRLGSVAEAVILHAPTSVLVVPPGVALGAAIGEAISETVACAG